MSNYDKTFDWVGFPEGRARFCGMQRGWDERGHVVFAIEIGGTVRYGEIDQVFLDNGNDYNIEVPTFGYARAEEVGLPGAQDAVSADELRVAQVLLVQLVRAGLAFEDPPNILVQSGISRFMGKVLFREGWSLSAQPGEAEVAP